MSASASPTEPRQHPLAVSHSPPTPPAALPGSQLTASPGACSARAARDVVLAVQLPLVGLLAAAHTRSVLRARHVE